MNHSVNEMKKNQLKKKMITKFFFFFLVIEKKKSESEGGKKKIQSLRKNSPQLIKKNYGKRVTGKTKIKIYITR